MERYDNIIKLEEIRRFVDNSQYKKAEKVLDTVDLHKIKSLTDLSIIADVYAQNERYDEAINILTKMYAKTKTRRLLYQLIEVSIKQGNIKEAENYLSQYNKVAPNDSYRYIFRYCIDKKKGESLDVLIESLEQLKEFEYIENWAYELAKLYHKAGKKDKCIRECSDIVLWFGEGLFVEKAKLLKAYYVGEINPIHMLKAKEKKEAEQRLALDKTKDFSSVRSQIDQMLEEEEAAKTLVHQLTDTSSLKLYDEQIIFEEKIKVIEDEDELDQKLQEYILNGETIELSEDAEFETPISEELEELISEELISEGKTSPREITVQLCDEEEVSEVEDSFTEIFNNVEVDYKKMLGYYYVLCKDNIQKAFTDINIGLAKNKFLIITGNAGTGKTTLANKISKIMQEAGWMNSSKVAKIKGDRINQLDLMQKVDQLMDCTLIIEDASSLNTNAILLLVQLIDKLNGRIFVVLEDTPGSMFKFMEKNKNLKELFRYSIQLPEYTRSDLFAFADTYIKEQNYLLTNDSADKMREKIISITETGNKNSEFREVMNFIKLVKKSADERYQQELLKVIGEREIVSTDFLYIIPDDFNC